MTRAAAFGLPWIALMAISVTLAYAMSMAVTNGLSTTAQADGPVPTVIDRPVGSEACVNSAWVVYVGQNTWIPDAREPCRSETTVADH